MDDEYMCPNCTTPWKCNGPHILEDDPNTDTIFVSLAYSPKEFEGKYNLNFREQLAQDAYDAVLERLEAKYPYPFED